jgi:proteasome accessory factor A
MSEFATALKAGTTWLVTQLLETGWKSPVRLVNPVQSIKDIARDQTYKWDVPTHERGIVSAVDLQRIYLYACQNLFAGRGADTDWILTNWENTLTVLAEDPLSLDDRLDWVAKRLLLADYAEYEGLDWKSDALRSVDLAYCNVDPEEGLYYGLEQSGAMVRLTSDEDINIAKTQAPSNTRAAIRGALVERFAEDISRIGWSKVILKSSDQAWVADLDDYLTPESVAFVMERLATDSSLADFIKFVYDNGKSSGGESPKS